MWNDIFSFNFVFSPRDRNEVGYAPINHVSNVNQNNIVQIIPNYLSMTALVGIAGGSQSSGISLSLM
jgi:hypothetical protein